MIIRKEHGTKEEGTYILRLSHDDIGYNNIKMYFDYTKAGYKKYKVYISITKINNGVAFLIEQQEFDCNYSELADVFKGYFQKKHSYIKETLIKKSANFKGIKENVQLKTEGPLGSIYTSNNKFKEVFMNKISTKYIQNNNFQLSDNQQLLIESNFKINYEGYSEPVNILLAGNDKDIKRFIYGLEVNEMNNFSYEIHTYNSYSAVVISVSEHEELYLTVFTHRKDTLEVILKAIGCSEVTKERYVVPDSLFKHSIDEFTYEDFNDLFSLDEETFSSVISAAIKRA